METTLGFTSMLLQSSHSRNLEAFLAENPQSIILHEKWPENRAINIVYNVTLYNVIVYNYSVWLLQGIIKFQNDQKQTSDL